MISPISVEEKQKLIEIVKLDDVANILNQITKFNFYEDSEEKKGASLLASTPVVVLSTILGRTPSIEEYKSAVEGIDLTTFSPPV